MKKIYALLLLVTITFNYSVYAQEKKDEDKKEDKKSSYFKFATTYLTNAVYSGRKDSAVLPYITPSLGYYDKSGFYVSGALSYLASSAASRIDLFSLTTGYDFKITKQLSAGINATKDFYTASSTAVRSEIKGSLGGNLSYDAGFISLNAGVDLMFSDQTDVSLNTSIAHAFTFENAGNEWSITPTIAANLGTQNYYQSYLKNVPNTRNRNAGRGGTSTVQVQQNKFGILDYELSLPIAYDAKKWGLFFTPTYAIPQNPVSYTASGGSTYTTEKLENVFYAEFGVYFKF